MKSLETTMEEVQTSMGEKIAALQAKLDDVSGTEEILEKVSALETSVDELKSNVEHVVKEQEELKVIFVKFDVIPHLQSSNISLA